MSVAEVIDFPTPIGNTDEAIAFLERWHGGEPVTVITISPEPPKRTIRRDFAADDAAGLHALIDAAQGRLNVYYVANACAPGSTSPRKDEMRAGRALYVDVDAKGGLTIEEAAARCRAFEPPPTHLIFSGGGYQALWRMGPNAEPGWADRVEAANTAIERAAGGDNCHNANRLLRLPGTVNVPDATKRARGRVPALAYVVEADWDRTITLGTVPALPEGVAAPPKQARVEGADGPDRSRVAFRTALGMLRARRIATYAEMCTALRENPETASWVSEKGEKSGERELKRIWEKIELRTSGPPWHIRVKAPYDVAELFLRAGHETDDDLRTLYFHRDGFYHWTGVAWTEIERVEARARVAVFLRDECVTRSQDENGEGHQRKVDPNTALVNEVLDALRATALLPARVEAPCWLGEAPADPAAHDIVACTNGLLHLPTGTVLAHSPRFYSHNALDFAYDPAAKAPEWDKFLRQLWPEDDESIQTLQEIFGYCLGADTSQQKAFLLVGARRSGKGTIARVLRVLVGADNWVGPTLAGLGSNFGLQPLIGKRLAIISDARLGGRADQAVIAERLLSVTGEDGITVDRKNREAWTGQLRARFLILTNLLPRINDASGALASRFILLALTESFYGREDHGLLARLLGELPGILNFAIEGWRRLRDRGYFVQPASAVEMAEELDDLGSPIGAFLRDRCDVGPGKTVSVDELFNVWKLWCEDQGRDRPGNKATFGRDLRAAVPGVKTTQPRTPNGERDRLYEGVGLRATSYYLEDGQLAF